MVKSIKASSLKIRSSFVFGFFILFSFSAISAAYIDQIVLETPNAAKSIYDIRVYSFIENLYLNKKIIDVSSSEWLKTDFESDRQGFIEQYLVQLHATEEETTLKPSVQEVQNAKLKIDSVFKSTTEKNKMYRDLGLDDDDVIEWLVNRLTLDKFLQTTIQNRIVMNDQKVLDHYATWKKDRFGNKSFDETQQKVKEDLAMTLLDEEFQKWVDQEKRRRKLVVKSLRL